MTFSQRLCAYITELQHLPNASQYNDSLSSLHLSPQHLPSLSLSTVTHIYIYQASKMGSCQSTPSSRHTSHNCDWASKGRYIPHRYQSAHRKERRKREHEAWIEQRRNEEIARQRRYAPIEEKKRQARREWDEYQARKKMMGK